MISCLLLSAGLSQRFGSPKALAPIGGTTVIGHLQNTLLKTSCDEIIVVLGAHAKAIESSIVIHSRIRIVYNKDYNLGQTSSVQAGWRQAHEASQGILFLPVDCPMVSPSTIDQIIRHFQKNQPDILVPAYHNKKGHPPVFSRRLKEEALKLPADSGLNSLFAGHAPQTVEINDPGIVKSFNTKEEFEEIKKIASLRSQ